MPTISLQRDDLEALIAGLDGKPARIPVDQLEQWLMLVKGELKGHNPETGELRIELQDSNRPDLWCCEGIARQIRIKRQGKPSAYTRANQRAEGADPRLHPTPQPPRHTPRSHRPQPAHRLNRPLAPAANNFSGHIRSRGAG